MKNKNVYIIGIEGAGTSALAQILVSRGARVSGSDDGDGFYRDVLREIGVEVFESFDAAHISSDIDLAIHSTAFGKDNVEIAQIRKRGIRLLSYPEAVSEIFNDFPVPIAVCGTHGKTTTTALTAEILRAGGADPVALVGAPIVGWEGNALTGDGDVMVLEADEYQNKLRHYRPKIIILTSIDYDHPDFFVTFDDYKRVFGDFISRLPADGLLVACGDDETVREVVDQAEVSCEVIYYGFGQNNDAVVGNCVSEIVRDLPRTTFEVCDKELSVALPGRHNALNATAASLIVRWLDEKGLCCDLPDEAVSAGLNNFRGVRRRFEFHGEFGGAILIDDYAHHPAEISATLSAARTLYPKRRIIAAFHPHTFTRTRALLNEFARSFVDSDEVIVIDIYGSAREKQGGVSAPDLVDEINEITPHKARYLAEISDLAAYARENLRFGDVFITLGAGDIWKVHDLIKRQSLSL